MKRRERAQANKAEFSKTRAVIGNRIMMCRIKIVGRLQHYYSAKAKLASKLDVFRKRRQEDERRTKKRNERSKREARKRWAITREKE